MMKFPLLFSASAVLLALSAAQAQAQPRAASPDSFGDRQIGKFGDPGKGHFGDPSKGNFDDNAMKEPPVGTEPQGKVYKKSVASNAEYLNQINAEQAVAQSAAVEVAAKTAAPTKKKKRRKN